MTDLSADDSKLVVLARAARARVGSRCGAAVRDETGRTYTGADVGLPSLSVSAVGLAVAQAAASGAQRIDVLVVVGPDDDVDTSPARDLGCGLVISADPQGAVLSVERHG